MPSLISREEALARIRQEGGSFACLMCALRDGRFGSNSTLFEDDTTLVILPRYVRRWGHVLLIHKPHVTSLEQIDDDGWLRLCKLGRQAARVIERVQRPRRCYLASTGSSGGELTQSSEHLHLHVIPIFSPDDRPASVFSWSDGLYVAEPDEWQALLRSYQEAWASL